MPYKPYCALYTVWMSVTETWGLVSYNVLMLKNIDIIKTALNIPNVTCWKFRITVQVITFGVHKQFEHQINILSDIFFFLLPIAMRLQQVKWLARELRDGNSLPITLIVVYICINCSIQTVSVESREIVALHMFACAPIILAERGWRCNLGYAFNLAMISHLLPVMRTDSNQCSVCPSEFLPVRTNRTDSFCHDCVFK